ncbi:Gryzun, putative trafficking through golgi-domain-containing protein [Jimgerdemannia flammicorona]|uniref:Gryzun, putative trafficking through golgi-domain-containing protein n=1 Tax=Jimgerdemannia flammicorona TaxID=994334 RepID=A0A433CXZ2_9FUNG|nr:Gryzun, putative trafficking through golgi-domain-containing protein [Jimgerdemannia flammicorona]
MRLLNTRKYFHDRGVKFAAVVILKQQHIDDVAIEDRLSFIRKASVLDSKNSFFVLPPGGQNELQDFVNNLYRSLYDYALSYYSQQVKRIRKKRARLPAPTSSSRPPMAPSHPHQAQTVVQPLNVQGWMIRYDIKAGMFSEFKQDIDGATRSYESAYGLLLDTFAPTSTITPGYPGLSARSKRWVESRMLADCLNLKICRLHMFLDNHPSVLAQLNRHLHAFQSFSTTWGMGEGSFEYWAWLSKQYRIFADNLDVAIKAGFKLPIPTPQISSSSPNIPANQVGPNGAGLGFVGLIGGVNPGTVLQHAGFYYHVAAMCSAERRRRFLEMEKAEKAIIRAAEAQAALQTPTSEDEPSKESETVLPPTPSGNAMLLTKERQIDHPALTIDLLTKGYEQFKKHKNARMTLYLAAEIAGTYYEAGKYEMALKYVSVPVFMMWPGWSDIRHLGSLCFLPFSYRFFERIGKTYRKENWHTVLTSILRWSLRCAKELGAWDHVVEYLIELMAGQLTMAEQKRIDIQTELNDIIYKNEEANASVHRPIILNMDQLNSFLTCSVQFKSRTTTVGTAVSFQITLATHPDSPPMPFRFTFMRIVFSDVRFNQWYTDLGDNSDKPPGNDTIEWIDCTDCELTEQEGGSIWTKKIDLRFVKNASKVIEGVVLPIEGGDLKVLTVTMGLESPHWNVQLYFSVADRVVEQVTGRRKWLEVGGVSEDAQLMLGTSTGTQQPHKFTMLDGRGDVPVLRVNNRAPQIDVEIRHSSPAFLDECYPLNVSVINSEAEAIQTQISVEIKAVDGQESADFVTLEPIAGEQYIGPMALTDIDVGTILPGEVGSHIVYLHGTGVAATRQVTITIHYSVPSQSGNLVERQEVIRVPFMAAFDTTFEIYPQIEPPRLESSEDALDFLPPSLERTERNLLVAAVKSNGPWDIAVEGVELLVEVSLFTSIEYGSREILLGTSGICETNNPLGKVTQEYSAGNFGTEEHSNVWKPGYIFSGNYLLRLTTSDMTAPKSPVRVGTLVITWRRHSDDVNDDAQSAERLPLSKTVVDVPNLEFIKNELALIADIPPEAHVGEPFTLTYTVHNPTLLLVELAATIELTDAFVFSGYKQTAFRVLPLSSTRFHYNCYPILTGRVKLPRFKVVVKKEGTIVGVEREIPMETVGGRSIPYVAGAVAVVVPEKEKAAAAGAEEDTSGQLLVFSEAATHNEDDHHN